MTTFRRGDLVTIEAEVIGDPFDTTDGKPMVEVRIGDLHRFYAETKHILMKTPKIDVRDIVEWQSISETWRGEVMAVAEGHAWISMGDGNYSTVWLPKIARIDPPPMIAVEISEDEAAAIREAGPGPVVPRADGGANIVTKQTLPEAS